MLLFYLFTSSIIAPKLHMMLSAYNACCNVTRPMWCIHHQQETMHNSLAKIFNSFSPGSKYRCLLDKNLRHYGPYTLFLRYKNTRLFRCCCFFSCPANMSYLVIYVNSNSNWSSYQAKPKRVSHEKQNSVDTWPCETTGLIVNAVLTKVIAICDPSPMSPMSTCTIQKSSCLVGTRWFL